MVKLLDVGVSGFIVEYGPHLPEDSEEAMQTFNEDILCTHGTDKLTHSLKGEL